MNMDEISERERARIFNSEITSPLCLYKKNLRTELESELLSLDEDNEMAIGFLRAFSKEFSGSVFALQNTDLELSNRIRSYKGVMNKFPLLKGNRHENYEVKIVPKKTRLFSLIELKPSDFNTQNIRLLSNYYGVFICADIKFEDLIKIVPEWTSYDDASPFSLDDGHIVESLLGLKTVAILKYFPADNGMDENISIIGNEGYVRFKIASVINSVLSHSRGRRLE